MELRIENLCKAYGSKTALADFSVTFYPGIYGILGANGAGKSTLMNLITDNIPRTSGSITFDGTDILKLVDSFRAVLGYMPQAQGIYEQMTAWEFVCYIGRLKGLSGKELRRQTERVLELTNLTDCAHRRLGGFSCGMKQRALLAQALLAEPKVLLLDEPTAGLDPRERIRIRSFIKELSKNKIVLLATHIVSDIESIADEVLLMKSGRIIRMDTPQDLISDLPQDWEPIDRRPSLEDVYQYWLGE